MTNAEIIKFIYTEIIDFIYTLTVRELMEFIGELEAVLSLEPEVGQVEQQ